jgi:hypothetical protein
MKYLLLMYATESIAQKFTKEEHHAAAHVWYGFSEEIKAAGVWRDNNGLNPVSDATTVRIRQGKMLTADGPFAETHEQLAGYFLIECADLDEATGWAAKIPIATYGSVEIRPLFTYK